MIQILIVSSRKTFLGNLLSIFKKIGEIDCTVAESGKQGLQLIEGRKWDLVVADEKLEDMTGINFIKKVINVNALINFAAASSLSHDDFHEACEGLGVMTPIPLEPREADGKKLIEKLKTILKITAGR